MNKINSIRPTQEQLYVTLAQKIGYVDCDAKKTIRHLATSWLGNIFWRHSRFSPKQPELQTHGDFNVSLFKQQTRLLLQLWRTYLTRISNNALT